MQQLRAVKFNAKQQPEFFSELRHRVNEYFKENGITHYANTKMKVKTAFMCALYFLPLLAMATGAVHTFWPSILMWVLMGFGMSGIGLSIMHDANHGAYSNKPFVNKALGFLLNFIGGYPPNWRIQHNVLHHSFTNVEGFDEDINQHILRLTPHKPWRPIHRFQVIYAPFLYSLMTIYWALTKDFEQLVRYQRKDLLKTQGLTYGRALAELIVNKIWYFGITFFLPWYMTGLPFWQVLIGFMIMEFICGLILALIFQPAHVVEETEFFAIDENGSVENSWAIHQLKTTTNFAKKSVLFSWFVGGLNFQVEHHLFPNICHIHYSKIAPIVKATAQEYNVPYYEYPTFRAAVASHFRHLYQLGRAGS